MIKHYNPFEHTPPDFKTQYLLEQKPFDSINIFNKIKDINSIISSSEKNIFTDKNNIIDNVSNKQNIFDDNIFSDIQSYIQDDNSDIQTFGIFEYIICVILIMSICVIICKNCFKTIYNTVQKDHYKYLQNNSHK